MERFLMSSYQHPVVTAADEAFVAAFHAHQLSNEGFHHRDHLRLAWVQIRRLGLEQAAEVVTNGIRRFASHHGSAERYNDTMTRFWLRVVAIGPSKSGARSFSSWARTRKR